MDKKAALIVDDSSLARMMVRKIFSTTFTDWMLIEAKDAEEALTKVADTHLDLALIDFNMPGMNGIDLAEKLMGQQPDMPIHLVTANFQDRMRMRAEAMGIGLVQKPISAAKISEIMPSA